METPQNLRPIIPRHSSNIVLAFALIVVLSGVYVVQTYQATLTQSKARQPTVAKPVAMPFDWVPLLVRGEIKFYSLSGQEILAEQYLSPPDEPQVHVVFLGDEYSDLEGFHQDVTGLAKQLATQSPLQAVMKRLYFHYVDQPQRLDCRSDGRLFHCDYEHAISELTAAKIPADYLVIMRDVSGSEGTSAASMVYDIREKKERSYYEKLP